MLFSNFFLLLLHLINNFNLKPPDFLAFTFPFLLPCPARCGGGEWESCSVVHICMFMLTHSSNILWFMDQLQTFKVRISVSSSECCTSLLIFFMRYGAKYLLFIARCKALLSITIIAILSENLEGLRKWIFPLLLLLNWHFLLSLTQPTFSSYPTFALQLLTGDEVNVC